MKSFIILAGPNGSGKSSFLSSLKNDSSILEKRGISFKDLLYINADYCARTNPHISQMEDGDEKDKAAWDATEIWRNSSLENGENIIWETVFSHESRLEIIERAHSLGYYVLVFYVTTLSPTINIERVKKRVQEGGHDVPSSKIVSRYDRSTKLIPKILLSADEVFVYDNSSDKPIITFCKVDKQYIENTNIATQQLGFFIRSQESIGDKRYNWMGEHIVKPLNELGNTITHVPNDKKSI